MESPLLCLSPELLQNIASFLDPNFVAAAFKLTCKEVAEALRKQYRTIQLRGEPRMLKDADDVRWPVAIAAQPWPAAAFVAHWGRPEPWRALPRWQRLRLSCLAASSHHPPSLDAALAHCGTAIGADALASAITVGDLDGCRRVYETEGCSWDDWLVGTTAGLSGSLPVCEWLFEAMPRDDGEHPNILLPAAIFAGHGEVLEWALESFGNDRGWSDCWLRAAAKAGRLELMQRLAARYSLDLREQGGHPSTLAQVAFGCPLAALQQYYEPWGTGLLEGPEQKLRLLLAAAASPTPDWPEKCDWLLARAWQLLASRGLGSCLERHAPTAAGALGSTAAVEFCLDQLSALLQQHAAAPVVAAGGGGRVGPRRRAPAGRGRQRRQQQQQQQQQQDQQINESVEHIATAAAVQGHVPVLRLLRARGFVFRARHLLAAVESVGEGCHETSGLASLRYLLLEDPAVDLAQGATSVGPSTVFRHAAVEGADLALLQHLHEQLGAAIDLVAVAKGGSEEALSWAVAALEAAGQAPEPLSCYDMRGMLSSGNWAAADWLVRHGLAPPNQELLTHMLSEDPWSRRELNMYTLPDLQWVVGMHGRQDRAHALAQVQWTAELRAALARIHPYGVGKTPSRVRWLKELEEAVAAELAAAAGEPPGAGHMR
ncbi:hypothetical protein HXX76_014610 [Chlamydomonas incerta]|uniref:Uncharacterized protein n=1 Tax=Chlamydomonas incerta TaxID=51695 RepID=A0A835SR34_CHLIN|nr:hypothetical protein HXX76_014610 [Chlamydomonas incerta]|eukprot:KAG2424401.1 hypothetical protein HXX76_014610 [Chlamydomonas incerta]